MQKDLLLDVKKRNNREAVKLNMEKTFALRRHEVVRDAPMVESFMARWPALFEVSDVRHFMLGFSLGFTIDRFYDALSPL